jgi:Ca2+-binding EF-hand superfamily protein
MLSDLKRRKLTKLFAMYDTCNSGYLKFADYEQIVKKLADLRGFKIDSPEYEKLMDKYGYQWIKMRGDIKDTLRKHLDYQVTLEEWLEYYEQVLQDSDHQKQIKSLDDFLFDVVDADGSGDLGIEEWKSLYRVFNIPVVYADDTFKHIDADNNNSITRQELFPMLEEFYYSENPDVFGNRVFGPI